MTNNRLISIKTTFNFRRIAEQIDDMTSDPDQALLNLMRENARASSAELARRLGVSRTTVQSRLERLERKGVIAGYSVKLGADYEKSLVQSHVLITVSPKLTQQVVTRLAAIEAVRVVHSVSGSFDMIAELAAQSMADLDAAIDAIGEMDGVERTLSSIILSTRLSR